MSVALPHDVIDMWRTLIISLLCSVTLPVIVAQPCRVQGVVIDADSALPGVNVALAGTTTGTSTDAQGRFKLDIAQAGRQVIRFSFLGYGTMERTISSEPGRTIDLGTITLTRNASELGEVVVSGTLSAISRDASPVPVEVITPLLFRHNPEPNLIGSIGMVNGVRPQINCSVCNTGDIHINGMEGPYTMVLIDGMPIVSSLGTVYGLSGIPTSLIERVEIVKGPGSALYGSEAMGGIINVITKDPVLAPRLALDLSVTTWSEYNADLGIKLGNDRFSDLIGVNVFSYGDPRDDNGDGFTDLTLQQRISVFNKIALRRPERKAASLATRYLTEDRWGGQMNWTPEFAGGDSIYGESISTNRWEAIGQYQLNLPGIAMVQFSAIGHHQRSFYGVTPYNADQAVYFGQVYWDRKLGPRSRFLAGLAYRYSVYDDNTPATEVRNGPEATTNAPDVRPLPGLFLQEDWMLTEAHELLLGYRLDHDRDHGLVHSPRLAYKWAPSGRWTLRANFGSGFRVVNLFTEEHAALTGSRTVVVTEELRPERSWNGTLNLVRKWPGEKQFIGLDASLFHTWFSNRIIPDYATDPDLIIYTNLDGYGVAQGAALQMETRWGKGFKALAGVTWMNVYTVEIGIQQEQLFAPEWQGTFTLSKDLPHRFTLDLTGQWYGPMLLPVVPNDPRPEYSPWYALVNVQARHRVSDRFEVYGGVRNLLDFVPKDPLLRPFDPFDRAANDPVDNPYGHSFDASYIYAPLQGVRGFMGMRLTLE